MKEEDEEGLITLGEWAAQNGYSPVYAVGAMPRYYADFPAPKRTRTGASEKGGGGGSNLYDPAELERFRPRRPDPVELPEEDLSKQVTLGSFAKMIGVNTGSLNQIKDDRPDTLPPTVDGHHQWYPRAKYYAGDLLLMWNSRPGRGPGSDKRRTPTPWKRS